MAEKSGFARPTTRSSEQEIVVDVDALHLEKVHHEAHIRHFTIASDEPSSLGGDDGYPNPLGYFLAGVAF